MTDKKPCPVCEKCKIKKAYQDEERYAVILENECNRYCPHNTYTCPNRIPDPAVAKLEKIREIIVREKRKSAVDKIDTAHYEVFNLATEIGRVLEE